MGYNKQLLVDYTLFDVSPQMIAEAESKNNGRVIVKGVLQRAGSKNQNGRVYPKDILMREVANYKKVQIAEKRALSRSILTICGLYQLGVFGEDESESFKKSNN